MVSCGVPKSVAEQGPGVQLRSSALRLDQAPSHWEAAMFSSQHVFRANMSRDLLDPFSGLFLF